MFPELNERMSWKANLKTGSAENITSLLCVLHPEVQQSETNNFLKAVVLNI